MKKIKLFRILIFFILLLAGLIIRLVAGFDLQNISFRDGGRDILNAKHILDGTQNMFTSPNSGMYIIPNTPVYYWVVAIGYGLGGVNGVFYLCVFSGILLLISCFLIAWLLTKSFDVALSVMTLGVFSYAFIHLSVDIWSPNIQLSLAVLTIYFTLKAFIDKKDHWYWLAVILMLPAASLHGDTLAPMALVGVFLNYAFWKKQSLINSARANKKKWWFLLTTIVLWLIFLFLTFWNKPNYYLHAFNAEKSLIENVLSHTGLRENLSKKAVELLLGIWRFMDPMSNFNLWMQLMLGGGLILLLIRNYFYSSLPKIVIIFLATLFLSLGLFVIAPGAEFRDCYFYPQLVMIFILVAIMPYYFIPDKKLGLIVQYAWCSLFLIQMWSAFEYSFTFQERGFAESQKIANLVATDAVKYSEPSVFLVFRENYNVEFRLKDAIESYNADSAKLALEIGYPEIASRIINRIDTTQKSKQLFGYIICHGYQFQNKQDCVTSVINHGNAELIRADYLTRFSQIRNDEIFLYRVRAIIKD